jgi:hypothetical protein
MYKNTVCVYIYIYIYIYIYKFPVIVSWIELVGMPREVPLDSCITRVLGGVTRLSNGICIIVRGD